jgi:hypothetical protein
LLCRIGVLEKPKEGWLTLSAEFKACRRIIEFISACFCASNDTDAAALDDEGAQRHLAHELIRRILEDFRALVRGRIILKNEPRFQPLVEHWRDGEYPAALAAENHGANITTPIVIPRSY